MRINNGFTISELVIAFIIIGVLTTVSLMSINNKPAEYFSRYSNARVALERAAYNSVFDISCEDEQKNNSDLKCPREFPVDGRDLCCRLTEIINFLPVSEKLDGYNGHAEETIRNTGLAQITSPVSKGCPKRCSILENDKKAPEIFNTLFDGDDRPEVKFIASNNNVYYFSKKLYIKTLNGDQKDKIEYFVVYVDLNGAGKNFGPNTTEYSDRIKPDIVPFVVTRDGSVIPVGFPVYDKTYIAARVEDGQKGVSKSFTFDEARQIAYGNSVVEIGGKKVGFEYRDIPYSIDFKDELLGDAKCGANASGGHGDPKEYDVCFKGNAVLVPEYYVTRLIGKVSPHEEYGCNRGSYACILKIDTDPNARNQ